MMSSDMTINQSDWGSRQCATKHFLTWTLCALFSNSFQTQSGNETSSLETVHACLMNAPGFQLMGGMCKDLPSNCVHVFTITSTESHLSIPLCIHWTVP